eukprot:jgi/Psemu1/58852/gm1.58852_g
MPPNKKPLEEDKAVAALVQQMAGISHEDDESSTQSYNQLQQQRMEDDILFHNTSNDTGKVWKLIVQHRVAPQGFKEKHLLWALHFLKQYSNITVMTSKTLRKWINIVLSTLNALYPHVIKWSNHFTNDRGNNRAWIWRALPPW